MTRSRRKKRKSGVGFKLILFVVFAVLAAFAFSGRMMDQPFGKTEYKNLLEWFELSPGEVKVYLDFEPDQEMVGKASDGTVYLPYDYVLETLNQRFFWSSQDRMLSFTLPDETVDYHADDRIGGAPVFKEFGDELYLSLDVVESYTNLTDYRFVSEDIEAKRVFLYTGGSEILKTDAVRKTAVRTKCDKKAPVLTELKKGDTVFVSERDDDWSRVATMDGLSGYVKTKALDKPTLLVIPDSYTEPTVNHTLLDEKVVMGWHGVYNQAGNSSFRESVGNTGGALNVISPTWIQISDAAGHYENYTDAGYIEEAHAKGLKVWVCVDNFNQPGGLKDFSTKEYFGSAEGRRDFISRLMADAAKYGYDGFNLDFEGLPTEAGACYVQFIRELSIECRKKGIVLSVDNYVPYGFNDFYNISEQGVFADYVVVMLYDEHTDSAGSVASIDYTDFGITETGTKVAADRIIAGLPLYTRLWTVTDEGVKSSTYGMRKAANYAAEKGIQLKWDEAIGQYYGELQSEEETQMIWMEDAESLALKMKLVEQNQLGGIALWRLGYEPAEIWDELDYAGRKNGN